MHSGTLLCLLLCATPAGLTAGPVLEPAAAHAAATGPEVEELLAQIERAAASGSSAGLLRLADAIFARPDRHSAANDRLLRELALAFAQVSPDPAARTLLGELAGRPPGVRVWLRDGPHRIDVLLYDVAAAARYTSRRWAEESARTEARRALQGGNADLVDRFAAGDANFRKGVIAALDDVSSAALFALRDTVAAALRDGADVSELALPLALRFADRELAEAVMRYGDPALAVHAVQQIGAALPPADALAVLESALSRTGLASAALLAIGRLTAAEPRARDVLFASLDDPQLGGSAAAALASLPDAEVAQELGRRLENGRNGLPERRALLALRLSESDAARRALDEFLHSSKASATLQQEAKSWPRP